MCSLLGGRCSVQLSYGTGKNNTCWSRIMFLSVEQIFTKVSRGGKNKRAKKNARILNIIAFFNYQDNFLFPKLGGGRSILLSYVDKSLLNCFTGSLPYREACSIPPVHQWPPTSGSGKAESFPGFPAAAGLLL